MTHPSPETIREWKERIRGKFPYTCALRNEETLEDAEQWCRETLGPEDVYWFNFGGATRFRFTTETEMMHFKMRWG